VPDDTQSDEQTTTIDPVLAAYVAVINTVSMREGMADFGFDLTVAVDGLLITGNVIGAGTWFQRVADKMRADTAHVGGAIGEALAQPLERVRDQAHATEDPAARGVGYLHLVNAHPVVSTPGVVWQGGMALRIRLDRIAAWTFGGVSMTAL
jgi:hypothetical protein